MLEKHIHIKSGRGQGERREPPCSCNDFPAIQNQSIQRPLLVPCYLLECSLHLLCPHTVSLQIPFPGSTFHLPLPCTLLSPTAWNDPVCCKDWESGRFEEGKPGAASAAVRQSPWTQRTGLWHVGAKVAPEKLGQRSQKVQAPAQGMVSSWGAVCSHITMCNRTVVLKSLLPTSCMALWHFRQWRPLTASPCQPLGAARGGSSHANTQRV